MLSVRVALHDVLAQYLVLGTVLYYVLLCVYYYTVSE